MHLKKKLRASYRLRRENLKKEEREILSAKIKDQLLLFLETKKWVQNIHLFLPIEGLYEINTYPILSALRQSGKQIFTSVSNYRTNSLTTVLLEEGTEIVLDEKGIPVPKHGVEAGDELIQMVLVPLLAFDLKGNRLGYGFGFYDRFLRQLEQEVLKVGLSYFPAEKYIPAEAHDIPLDVCIFGEGITSFNSLKQ